MKIFLIIIGFLLIVLIYVFVKIVKLINIYDENYKHKTRKIW